MTQTEYLEQICANLGVDISTLPDRLLSTYLSAISEKLGIMKENGTLADFLEDFANGGGGTGGGELSAFWDVYQNYGNRTSYNRAFDGWGFSFDNFYPKYDIKPANGNMLFYAWENKALPNQKGSLTQRLKDCGVILDTSQCADIANAFAYSEFTSVPTVDFTGLTKNGADVFRGCTAVEIQKIIVKIDNTFSNWFLGCKKLSHIRVEGTIANNIDLKECPLDGESVDDIVTHLLWLGMGDDVPEWGSRTLYLSETAWANYEAYLWEKYPDSFGDYDGAKGYVTDNRGWNCV